MKTTKTLEANQILTAPLLAFIAFCAMFPTKTNGQLVLKGSNAVYCAGSSVCGSSAFIDASVFPGGDPCTQINNALKSVANSLVVPVIDARGLALNNFCTISPFNAITMPSAVLLPAGTITTSATWTLPSGTKIIGEGVGITTLAASNNISPLINMGGSPCSATNPCTSIGIQDLSLSISPSQTNPNSIVIDNELAQDLSYVQRVTISVGATTGVIGVKIGQYAQNSGPYSEIEVSGQGQGTGTACVQITQPATGIRIRGLNCIGNATFSAAVELDGSNNSIEDVYISSAYTDGILVGAYNNVYNDVLLNVTGGNTNTVHVCGPNGGNGSCSNTNYAVKDLSLLGISLGGSTNSIKDDVTGAKLPDTQVEMYILGESMTVASGVKGYARFTTSPNTVTWGVNTSAPSGNCTSATKGALFSNTTGTGGCNGLGGGSSCAFWVCTTSGWVGVY